MAGFCVHIGLPLICWTYCCVNYPLVWAALRKQFIFATD